jgi:hypothetical protein
MDPPSDPLRRLLHSAARAPGAAAAPPPFGFTTRVLAEWRSTTRAEEAIVATICRRAILYALGLALLVGGIIAADLQRDLPPVQQAADYTVNALRFAVNDVAR